MNLNDLIGHYKVIKLPRRELDAFRIIMYALSVIMFLIMVLSTFGALGIQILYSNIFFLSIFVVLLFGLIVTTYILVNFSIFKHPILVLSPRHIYLGTKNLGRSPVIYDTRLNPTGDMQLVIVKDSHSLKYRVFLEKKILLNLGQFSELRIAEDHRKSLRNIMAKYYPELYISAPLYQDI